MKSSWVDQTLPTFTPADPIVRLSRNGLLSKVIQYHLLFLFFKQKTAYEISECDWSSDVCSSDLKQKTAYENSSHIQKSRMPSSASDRKSTRLNSSHIQKSRMPSSA